MEFDGNWKLLREDNLYKRKTEAKLQNKLDQPFKGGFVPGMPF